MRTIKADVIIIGAGIVGNAAAYYLSKLGRRVIVLEKEMIGHGGSSRNGGGCRQSGRDPKEIELAIYANKNIWPNLNEALGVDVEWHQNGYMFCGYNEDHKDLIMQRIQVASKYGLEMDIYQGDDIKQINPYVSNHVKYCGFTPSDAVANPLVTTLAFYKRARELGAQFITGEEVVKLGLEKGRIRKVVTSLGNIYEADVVILAAGIESRRIYNTIGLDIPMLKRLTEVLVTEAAPPMFEMMVGGASGFYGQQTRHGSFVFGDSGGREAFWTELDDVHYPIASSNHAANTSMNISVDFPALANLKVTRHWAGWTDITPDGIPAVGKVREIPGLFISFGSSGHGFCPGPAVAYCIAEMIEGRPSPVDLSGLRPDRFDYINPMKPDGTRVSWASNKGSTETSKAKL